MTRSGLPCPMLQVAASRPMSDAAMHVNVSFAQRNQSSLCITIQHQRDMRPHHPPQFRPAADVVSDRHRHPLVGIERSQPVMFGNRDGSVVPPEFSRQCGLFRGDLSAQHVQGRGYRRLRQPTFPACGAGSTLDTTRSFRPPGLATVSSTEVRRAARPQTAHKPAFGWCSRRSSVADKCWSSSLA